MNALKELERIDQIEEDDASLTQMQDNYVGYIRSIANLSTRQDAETLEQELFPAFSSIDRWKSDMGYVILFTKINQAVDLRKALREKKEDMGLTKKKPFVPKEKRMPTLMKLVKEYDVGLDSNGKINSRGETDQGDNNKVVKKARREDEIKPIDLEKLSLGAPVAEPKSRKLIFLPQTKVQDEHPVKLLLKYYVSRGLVGEEATSILQTFGAVNRLCFGIESMSGSGKSYTIDRLIELLDKGDIYSMQLSSKTAEMYSADEINKAQIIYIPELQKAMRSSNEILVEVLKNITEGKDAQRKVRVQANGKNQKYTITAGKGVIFTLATENHFKYDQEFARRVFILHTDVSPEQTDNIIRYKSSQRHAFNKTKRIISNTELNSLRSHVKSCLYFNPEFENPFAEPIAEMFPRTLKSRSYDSYYFDLVESSTKFNHPLRIYQDGIMFVNLEDVYLIHNLYSKTFLKGLYNIPVFGEEALSILNEEEEFCESKDVYETLKEDNPSLSFNVVENVLENLVDAGFLKKDDYKSRNPKYSRIKSMTSLFDEPNWEAYWERGKEFMKEHYPKISERWINEQLNSDGEVRVYSPLGNDYVTLFKDNPSDAVVVEQTT